MIPELYSSKKNTWLRDFYVCHKCHFIPRQRAIVDVLKRFSPFWKKFKIHESSPGSPSSMMLEKHCAEYTPTQFFRDIPLGKLKDNIQCENLEKMIFEDNSFDLMITQDVFAHVMNPLDAFKEIERILKPGGAHVFTMLSGIQNSIRQCREPDS